MMFVRYKILSTGLCFGAAFLWVQRGGGGQFYFRERLDEVRQVQNRYQSGQRDPSEDVSQIYKISNDAEFSNQLKHIFSSLGWTGLGLLEIVFQRQSWGDGGHAFGFRYEPRLSEFEIYSDNIEGDGHKAYKIEDNFWRCFQLLYQRMIESQGACGEKKLQITRYELSPSLEPAIV